MISVVYKFYKSACFTDLGWLEAEAMRETTAGWQHVAWLDASQAAPGHQKRRHCLVGPQTIMWDGMATEGAALAESPDVFTGGITPFHRALPQVISGEPVPPPYYTIFFRYRAADSDSAEILDEANVKLYVPQVVKVEMTDAAYEEFKKPILYPTTFYPQLLGDPEVVGCESNVLLYAGCPDMTKSNLLSEIVETSQSFYPWNVNIRFTANSVIGRAKTVLVSCNYTEGAPRGEVIDENVFPNADTSGMAAVYMNVVRENSSKEKFKYENLSMSLAMAASCEIPTLFPFSRDNLAHAVASTSAHETGHLLGLVSEAYLGGKYNQHNPNNIINGWMMNSGSYTPCVYHLGSHSNRTRSWKPVNALYLRFILPKGDQ